MKRLINLNKRSRSLHGKISKEVTDLATNLYRLDKYESEQHGIAKNLEKRKFDVFHFATAKVNGIELLSNDKHISQLEDLYRRYKGI